MYGIGTGTQNFYVSSVRLFATLPGVRVNICHNTWGVGTYSCLNVRYPYSYGRMGPICSVLFSFLSHISPT